MDGRDPYDVLKIASNTQPEVIEAVYQMILARYGKSAESGRDVTEELEQAHWAYEILSDPDKRREYDKRIGSERSDDMGEHPDRIKESDSVAQATTIVNRTRTRNIASTIFSASVFVFMLAAIGAALYYVGAVPGLGNADEIVVKSPESTEFAKTSSALYQASVTPRLQIDNSTSTSGDAIARPTEPIEIVEDLEVQPVTSASNQVTPTPLLVEGCPSFSSINVRKGPGASYAAAGFIVAEDCVTFIGRNDDSTWVVVGDAPKEELEGQWVALSVVTVSGSIDSLPVVEPVGLPPPTHEFTETLMPAENASPEESPAALTSTP